MASTGTKASPDDNYGKIESSFEQVPYSSIVERLDAGSQCLSEFASIMAANLENVQRNISFSSTISRTHIYENEIIHSGVEKSLGFFKNYHLFVAKQQVQYHKSLSETVYKPIEEVKASRAAMLTKHKAAVQLSNKEVAHAHDALDKAKKHYVKAIADLNGAKERLLSFDAEPEKIQEEKKSNFMGRMLSAFESTPMQDREKQQRRVIKRINNVLLCRRDISSKRRMLKEKIGLRDAAIAQVSACLNQPTLFLSPMIMLCYA
jgi:Tfp pilus assembly major pilin PilA